MSYPSSQESEDSTSASSEPECQSSGNARTMPSAEPSSPAIGPESHARKMSPGSTGSGWQAWDSLNDAATDLVPTMGANTGMATGRAGVIFQVVNWQTGMDQIQLGPESPTLHKGQTPAVLISSAEDSHAKTCQSQENERGLPVNAQDCSSTQHESQTLFSGTEDGSSLRTYPDSFPAMEDLTSGSYSRRWPTSGFTTSPGELWTVDTSECPNGGGEYSSLPDVLEATVPERFYLSQKAAAGILRRAEKRGKELPRPLESALRALSEPETGATNLTVTEPTSV